MQGCRGCQGSVPANSELPYWTSTGRSVRMGQFSHVVVFRHSESLEVDGAKLPKQGQSYHGFSETPLSQTASTDSPTYLACSSLLGVGTGGRV
jgi:hypothetical protein